MIFKHNLLICCVLIGASSNAYAEMIGQPQPQKLSTPDVVMPAGTMLPMINVIYECGDCKPEGKIKALIEGTYLDWAEKEKVAIDDSKLIDYKVSKYRTRGGLRFVVGALAGADKIVGNLMCANKSVEISDAAVSAINGIESVARNVGESTFKSAKECVVNALGQASKDEQGVKDVNPVQ